MVWSFRVSYVWSIFCCNLLNASLFILNTNVSQIPLKKISFPNHLVNEANSALKKCSSYYTIVYVIFLMNIGACCRTSILFASQRFTLISLLSWRQVESKRKHHPVSHDRVWLCGHRLDPSICLGYVPMSASVWIIFLTIRWRCQSIFPLCWPLLRLTYSKIMVEKLSVFVTWSHHMIYGCEVS